MSDHISVKCKANALLWSMLFILIISVGVNCYAQDQQIVRVEEDWRMVVGDPDPENVAPQVTLVISPSGDVNSLFAAFTMNHRGMPEFSSGGLQLQVWDGETSLQTRNFPNASVLSQAGETVTWTQSMELKDGLLTFEVLNGDSLTWGEFGGQSYLKVNVNSSIQNLNNYTPSVSVQNSGIGFASNRVQSLVLVRVRRIISTGQILEDNTPRTVHQQE
jgi:hypothetical protein